jgi:hypothetical protein
VEVAIRLVRVTYMFSDLQIAYQQATLPVITYFVQVTSWMLKG